MEVLGQYGTSLHVLHYLFPTILLIYYFIAQSFSVSTVPSIQSQRRKSKRKPIVLLQFAVLLSYILEAFLLALDSLFSHTSHSSTDSNVSVALEATPSRPVPNGQPVIRI